MFWNIKNTLSYNCLFNFIIGNRGGGKSYGFKKWAIEDFIKTGAQFVYVRRYETEIRTCDRFFNDIYEAFPDHEMKYYQGQFIIDGEVAGWAIPLSKAQIMKSVPFPMVNKICFDEFIIDKGNYRYLRDEVTAFLELYETIARMRENVRVFFLANAITTFNPYFLYFNIDLPYGSNFKRYSDMLIEVVADTDYIDAKSKTRFAQLLKDTTYFQYSVENKMLRDNNNFIKKKTGRCRELVRLKSGGNYYAIWLSLENSDFYIEESTGERNNKCIVFALTRDDHSPDTAGIEGFKGMTLFKAIRQAVNDGHCFYSNQTVKNIMYGLFLQTLK